MEINTRKKDTLSFMGYGLTAAGIIGSYAIFSAAATGLNLLFALLCCIVCALFSVKLKNNILAPHPFMLVPLIYCVVLCSQAGAVLSLSIAALLFFICTKLRLKLYISPGAYAGLMLGFALATTVLLTNVYFGIGAYGATPFEMLKNYRYLGFHPNFMGLLTGTITLFTMITYPFKFKKLSKLIPPAFITVFIPYVLNLFLNPNKKYTTINEAQDLGKVTDFSLGEAISSINGDNVFAIVEAAFIFFFLFFAFSQSKSDESKSVFGLSNVFSCIPSVPYKQERYNIVSAITAIILCSAVILLAPEALHRIPMHSIGAMLIVAGWQSVPFKEIGNCFKSKKAVDILSFFICAAAFVVLKAYTATLLCLVLSLISAPKRKEKKNA